MFWAATSVTRKARASVLSLLWRVAVHADEQLLTQREESGRCRRYGRYGSKKAGGRSFPDVMFTALGGALRNTGVLCRCSWRVVRTPNNHANESSARLSQLSESAAELWRMRIARSNVRYEYDSVLAFALLSAEIHTLEPTLSAVRLRQLELNVQRLSELDLGPAAASSCWQAEACLAVVQAVTRNVECAKCGPSKGRAGRDHLNSFRATKGRCSAMPGCSMASCPTMRHIAPLRAAAEWFGGRSLIGLSAEQAGPRREPPG
jgi:hypothetical protein